MIQISLKAARVNANIKQKDAAKLINVSIDTMQNYENGKSEIPVSKALTLSKYYDLPIDNIFFGNELGKNE